ncbi:MAG: zf-HC2 domain-containing protein [Pseudomonadota bacterium]
MSCEQSLRVQAYFDGELASDEETLVVQHLAQCPACRELLADHERGRTLLRSEASGMRAPAQLRARIASALDAESASVTRGASVARNPARPLRSRPFWLGALAGLGLSGIAATLIVLLVLPMAAAPLVDELVAAHLHSLQPGQLISVLSSERHTVKPWFAGRADVSPTVADFTDEGFTLAGGRADAVLDQRAAVAVYRHGPHTINVFTWAESRAVLPHAQMRRGYRMLFWRSADLAYAAVSDASWDELQKLERLLQTRSETEQRPNPRRE